MDTAQWPQVINGVVIKKPMESSADPAALVDKRVVRAQKEQPLNCPRCNSCNTKFCYYNNYSLSQPRYFCKTCRRYWTQGGSLRNVPVGGGSRKNKRPPPPTSSSKKQATTLPQPSNLIQEGDHYDQSQNPSLTSSELSLSTYMPMIAPTVSPDSSTNNNSSTMFSSPGLLFPFQEFKPTLSYFSHGLMDSGISGGRTTLLHHHHHHDQETKIDGFEQQLINRGQGLDSNHSIGFLNNGMFGGGSWQQL